MTLEQYAYLGEIAAAIGVIISLAYVARQLGQNTEMMRVAAASSRVERDFEITDPLLHNREFAEVWEKGESELAGLESVDRYRLMFHNRRIIVLWHHLFQLRQKRLLPDADWHETTWSIQRFGRRKAVRETWEAFQGAYEAPFQAFIAEQFAIADDHGAPAA